MQTANIGWAKPWKQRKVQEMIPVSRTYFPAIDYVIHYRLPAFGFPRRSFDKARVSACFLIWHKTHMMYQDLLCECLGPAPTGPSQPIRTLVYVAAIMNFQARTVDKHGLSRTELLSGRTDRPALTAYKCIHNSSGKSNLATRTADW